MIVPCGNNSVVDSHNTNPALWVPNEKYEQAVVDFDKLGYSILTFPGNGLLERDIFYDLNLEYDSYKIKCITDVGGWDIINKQYPLLDISMNKNGYLYLLIGFESPEHETTFTEWVKDFYQKIIKRVG